MESIDNILTFEVKKEIAERYFGFRRIIEEDTQTYLDDVKKAAHQLEKNIGHDLVRIYTLLNQEVLIHNFLTITGLPERLFLDSFINTAPKKEGIFIAQKFRGITRKGCLHNMFFDAYDRLHHHIQDYREAYLRLQDNHDTICEQIRIFYRKNDIHTIFNFLRSLDNTSLGNSPLSFNKNAGPDMEKKLKIHPPLGVTELLPEIPAIPLEKKIRKELKALVTQACIQQPQLDLRRYKND